MAIFTMENKKYITTKDGLRALDDKKYFKEKEDDRNTSYNNINNPIDGKCNISSCNTQENGKMKPDFILATKSELMALYTEGE